MFYLPVGKQGTQTSVAQTFFLVLVSFDVESEGFVVDQAARPSELPQVAELLAIGSKFELECLQSQPNPIYIIGLCYCQTIFVTADIALPHCMSIWSSSQSLE